MSKSRISNQWTSHIKEAKDIQEMQALVVEARRVLERLDEILDKKVQSSVQGIRKTSNFEEPNWTHKVADQFGYERALEEIRTLIRIK